MKREYRYLLSYTKKEKKKKNIHETLHNTNYSEIFPRGIYYPVQEDFCTAVVQFIRSAFEVIYVD